MRQLLILSLILIFTASINLLLIGNSQNKDLLKFSHKLHIIDEELECSTCHEMAERSTTGRDNLMPTMDVCSSCHDVEDEENCILCHSNVEEPEAVPYVESYSEKFSHALHLSKGLECRSCHESIIKKSEVRPYILPKMDDCMECHQIKMASLECNSCHLEGENLVPTSHTPNFIHNHSDLARNRVIDITGENDCSNCHKPRFCQDCHEGDNIDRLTHPLNYEFTHALEAQGKEKECSVCHIERQFCNECHRTNLVMPKNHTAGWTNTIPNDGGLHRIEALNDIESCISCHEQNADQTCQPCHGPKN